MNNVIKKIDERVEVINDLYKQFVETTDFDIDFLKSKKIARICIRDLVKEDDFFASFKSVLHNTNASFIRYYGKGKNSYRVYILKDFVKFIKLNLNDKKFLFYKKYNKNVSVERFANMLKLFFKVELNEDIIKELYNDLVFNDYDSKVCYINEQILKKILKNM